MRGHGRTVATVAVMALLAGLAIGRFVSYEPAVSTVAPPRTAPTVEARLAALEQAVESAPADVRSWQALGSAYTQRAFEVGDPAFYGLAARALDRARQLHPEDAGTELGLGNLALALHDFAGARRHAQRARQRRPDSAEVLGVLVDAEVELGDYEAAGAHLQDMLDVRPGLPALARTSYLRELHGDLPGAVEAMQRAEAAGPHGSFDRAAVAALLGDLHFTRGALAEAEGAYRRALDASPGLVPAEVGLARVEVARGDTAAAVDRLTAVVDRFPQPDAVILLGDVLAATGDHEEAQQQYAVVRTIARLQEDAGQNVDLELALFEADRADDPQRALELANRAHAARPDNVYAADVLAWALLGAGRADEALAPMQHALRLGTADALVRFHAAAVFAATGQDVRAREELAAAFDLNPWFSLSHRDRAEELAGQLDLPLPAGWDAQ